MFSVYSKILPGSHYIFIFIYSKIISIDIDLVGEIRNGLFLR
jgi:hypothetical protein